MPTMVVLVNLKENVAPEEYERWLQEHYVPVVLDLPSVNAWHAYRVDTSPGSGGGPPYGYVVTVDVDDPGQLAVDAQEARMRELIGELGGYAEVTQLMTERFV